MSSADIDTIKIVKINNSLFDNMDKTLRQLTNVLAGKIKDPKSKIKNYVFDFIEDIHSNLVFL